jgi:hypothetical protein
MNTPKLRLIIHREITESACCQSDTLVTMSNGSLRPIGELKDGDLIIIVDPITLQQSVTRIHGTFSSSSDSINKRVYCIRTLNGREVIVTGDHSVLTNQGIVTADKLDYKQHLIAIYPGVQPLPHDSSHIPIVTRESFVKVLKEAKVKDSLIEKHWNDLTSLGYAPLYADHVNLPILARISGACLTDGTLVIYDGSPNTRFNFGTEYDAKLFESDIVTLGFSAGKIGFTSKMFVGRKTDRQSQRDNYSTCHSGCFASLLISLELTYGRKTMSPTKPIPAWVLNGSQAVKREFIAGFQGGDGGRIYVQENKRNHRINPADYSMNATILHKCPTHLQTLIDFFGQFKTLLTEFGIETGNITTKPDPNYEDEYEVNEDGEEKLKEDARMRVKLTFSSAIPNLIRYMDMIGYRYATTKSTESYRVTEYLRYRTIKMNERINLKKKVMELYSDRKHNGMTQALIAKSLGVKFTQVRSIVEAGNTARTNAPLDTIPYEEWLKMTYAAINCVYEPISSVSPTDPCAITAFTTASPSQIFTANGFCICNGSV